MARLLFISHDSSRSGAALQLRDMLRWLRTNTKHDITTVLQRDGVLVSEFEEFGPVLRVFSPPVPSLAARAIRKLLHRQPPSALGWAFGQLRTLPRFDLLYANTIAAGVAMGELRSLAHRTISHIHEMPTFISSFDPRAIEAVRRHAHHVLVPSSVAANGLCTVHGLARDRITVVPASVADPARADLAGGARGRVVRDAAGLPADAWVVGVCGTGAFLKGSDLLPRLAKSLPESVAGRPVHLVHVGHFNTALDRLLVERDARLIGVTHRLHLLGPTDDPAASMNGFDVHLLPSREESFGLVVLEAAALGIPSICFDLASGAADFCRDGAGVIVPYLSVEDMAAAARLLLDDSAQRTRTGAAARDRWWRDHRSEATLPAWQELVEAELGADNRP